MRRESKEIWKKRVERWGDSDLSAKEFAAEIGINANTLRQWKYRLSKTESPLESAPCIVESVVAEEKFTDSTETVPTFIEFNPPEQKPEPFEIQFASGTLLRVPPTIELGELIRILEDH